MSRKGVSSHGIISQMNLIFVSLQSIRNELQFGAEHARKKKVWMGNEGEERRLCTLPARGVGTPNFLLSSHALMASLVCILRIVLISESGSRLCRFYLFFCRMGFVTKRHLCESRLKSPLQVLELPHWLRCAFLCSLFMVCTSTLLRLKNFYPYPSC